MPSPDVDASTSRIGGWAPRLCGTHAVRPGQRACPLASHNPRGASTTMLRESVEVHPSRAAAVSALVEAITEGDVHEVLQLVARTPDLVIGPLGGPLKTRSALHIAADWPGFLPNGPRIVRVLLEGGADPNFRHPGDETPLHWAASSDDADVAAALLDGGADIEAP